MNWDDMVKQAHKVLEDQLMHGEEHCKLQAACTIAVIQAIDEVRESMPSEPFEVRNIGPERD